MRWCARAARERQLVIRPYPHPVVRSYVNAILASGWISDLFAKDELDGLMGMIRSDAKACFIPDRPEDMLAFLIKRFRKNFKVVLAFSPVGDTFRVRARRFPGLINCTSVDFFHPWPQEALVSVASRFLMDLDLQDDAIKDRLAGPLYSRVRARREGGRGRGRGSQ